MEFKGTNVQNVIVISPLYEDQKNFKRSFLKSMFINVKHYKIYQRNTIKVLDGFNNKYLNMNQMQKSINQEKFLQYVMLHFTASAKTNLVHQFLKILLQMRLQLRNIYKVNLLKITNNYSRDYLDWDTPYYQYLQMEKEAYTKYSKHIQLKCVSSIRRELYSGISQ